MNQILKKIGGIYLILVSIALVILAFYWLFFKQIHWAPVILLYIGVGFFYLGRLILTKFNFKGDKVEVSYFFGLIKALILLREIEEYNVKEFEKEETIYIRTESKQIYFFSSTNTHDYLSAKHYLINNSFLNKKLEITMWTKFNIVYLSFLIPIIFWVIIDKAF